MPIIPSAMRQSREDLKIVLPEIIPGLSTDDATAFQNWLVHSHINFRGWLSQKVSDSTSHKCRLIFVAWIFDSYLKERYEPFKVGLRGRKKLDKSVVPIVNAMPTSLSEYFWGNLHDALSIEFCNNIIESNGGVCHFILKYDMFRSENISRMFSILSSWPENKNLPEIFKEGDSCSNWESILSYADDNLLLQLAKKTSHLNDQLIICREMAYLYITEEYLLSFDDLAWVQKIINSKNFNNLIKDNIYLKCDNGFKRLIRTYLESSVETDPLTFLQIYNKQVKRVLYYKAKKKLLPSGKNKTTLDLNLIKLLPKNQDVLKQQLWLKILSHPKYDIVCLKPDDYEMVLSHLSQGVVPHKSILERRNFCLFRNFEQQVTFINSMVQSDATLVKDTAQMLNNLITGRMGTIELRSFNIDRFLKKFQNKCNSIEKVHDWLSHHVVNKDSVQFTQKISSLHDLSIGRGNKIFVPFNNSHLVKTGSSLSICVGNGGYLEKIVNNKSYIFFIIDEKTGDERYCVELSPEYAIIQAKGFKNRPMSIKTYARMNYAIDKELKKDSALWRVLNLFVIIYGNKFLISFPFFILGLIYYHYYT